MDVTEFAQVSAQLVEVGQKLKVLRDQRAELDREIADAEAALRPLLVQHQQYIAEVVGLPTAPVTPPTAVLQHVPTPTDAPMDKAALEVVKKRIRMFLENADEGVSAFDVANALHIDGALVRGIMQDWARGVA